MIVFTKLNKLSMKCLRKCAVTSVYCSFLNQYLLLIKNFCIYCVHIWYLCMIFASIFSFLISLVGFRWFFQLILIPKTSLFDRVLAFHFKTINFSSQSDIDHFKHVFKLFYLSLQAIWLFSCCWWVSLTNFSNPPHGF